MLRHLILTEADGMFFNIMSTIPTSKQYSLFDMDLHSVNVCARVRPFQYDLHLNSKIIGNHQIIITNEIINIINYQSELYYNQDWQTINGVSSKEEKIESKTESCRARKTTEVEI